MNISGSGPSKIAYLGADDGTSTDSEAGSSSRRGWSDASWNPSDASNQPRPSLSSGDEQPSNQPTYTVTTAHDGPPSPSASTRTVQHRKHTLTRPTIHTVGSNISLEALTPQAGGAFIYPTGPGPGPGPSTATYPTENGKATSSSPVMSNGYGYGPPNSNHTYGNGPVQSSPNAYGVHPRARGKTVLSDSDDVAYDLASASASSHTSKGKSKRRSRAGSSSYLPSHRRSSRGSGGSWPLSWLSGARGKRGSAGALRRWGLPLLLLLATIYAINLWRRTYELQVEFSVFSKQWIRNEVEQIRPVRGCFDSPLLSPEYNITKHLAPRRHLLSPGVALRREMSCYDYSATIQPLPDVPLEHITYHTYWRSDLLPFGERQAATFISFLATQPLTHSKLILWTNGADVVSQNEHVKPFLDIWGNYIEVRQVDMSALTKGTQLASVIGSAGGQGIYDQRGWVDGDAIRLLALWQYGGIWMDMDQLLTRDLHPLTESEWVTQWDCYEKPYFSLNGALMHFERHSPYLCEAFHIMATSPLPAPNTFAWGSHLYAKVHRTLLAAHIKPFSVLPWCFADPRNCRTDNRFPDPFLPDPKAFAGRSWFDGGKELLEEKVGHVWTVHLHNQWEKKFPAYGWIERLLSGYKAQMEMIKRYAEASGLVGTHDGSGRIHIKRDARAVEGEVEE